MARMKAFPKVIHVCIEDPGGREGPYLAVQATGVLDIDDNQTPIAVYQLVSTGVVEVKRRYVEKRKAK